MPFSLKHRDAPKQVARHGVRPSLWLASLALPTIAFRQFVRSTLEEKAEMEVICEISDGLEAVRKADELKPDLILLDIGLPSLNGIEAARQIRSLSPGSKILFLSQQSSADFVQEALELGALGYVVKIRAGSHLLSAVEAVMDDRQFVST